MADRDQFARYAELNDPDNAELKKTTARVNDENIVEFEGIIARVGWPGKSLVGTKASGEGLPQVYRTQFHQVDGEWVPRPIEDEANVDARRKSVGLGPLAEYHALFKQMHARKAKE
ncbi:MAG TPA: DUF6624 domain-containing protein [Thermoanaerobaculia bacterium]|nr:DUF6624 domain-containing protein [Thermoanaerobaculia bacterium]